MAKIKKAQVGKNVPKGMVESEMHPGKMIPKKEMDAWNKRVTKDMNDQYFSRPENLKYGKSKTKPAVGTKKKAQMGKSMSGKNKKPIMKDGGSLGMKSVKAGYDKNPGVTRADIIVAAKKQAKSGTKVKKAMAGCKACWGSKMKKSGK